MSLINFNFFSLACAACFLSFSGCVTTQTEAVARMDKEEFSSRAIYKEYYKKTRPFAVLYGNVKGRWIDQHETSAFGDARRKDYPPWIIERAGFIQLDEENQRLYLLLKFAENQPGNTEKTEQLTKLVQIYAEKFGIDSLRNHIFAQDKAAVRRFVDYLGGSTDQFYRTAAAYCNAR